MALAEQERCALGEEGLTVEQLEEELQKICGMAEHLWCLVWCRGRHAPYSLEALVDSYQRRFDHATNLEEVAFLAQHLERLGLVELRAERGQEGETVRVWVMPNARFF